MAKKCVFCGGKPRAKTKEHVIPLWLIDLTGDSNRKVALGWDKTLFGKELVMRQFAFDQLVFPACADCNARYSDLEVAAKQAMDAILNGREIETSQASAFLDWLDKVRVGLWLGFMQLDKNYARVDPNFHIDTRVGQYDRLVIVERTDSSRDRLSFSGIDCLSFALTPSAFALTVNNYTFTNISYQFLFARRVGFPYPSESRLTPDGRLCSLINPGRERIMRPLIRRPMRPGGVVLYQPMFKGGLIEPAVDQYDTEHVRKTSLDFEGGVGHIFVEDAGAISEQKAGDSFKVQPQVVHAEHRHHLDSAIEIYEWQNWLASLLPDMTQLDKRHQQYIKTRWNSARSMNNALIAHCKKVKKHYGL